MKSFFILLAILMSLKVDFARADFQIKPYLYTIKGQEWALSWSYTPATLPSENVKVDLVLPEGPASVPAKSNGLVYTAILPLPSCGFENISYIVTGQKTPLLINGIPCPTATETTRFSFMADTQEGAEFAHTFAQQLETFKGSAVLLGGDLVETGTNPKEWEAFFDALNPALQSQVLIPAVGNHEYRFKKAVPLWLGYFQTQASEAFYALDIGAAHVIALNSGFVDDPTLKVKELAFIQAELQKPARWKIVFYHHPAYSRGFFNSPEAPKKEYVTLQRDYIPLFEHYNVDLVLNGHTHLYEHSLKAGIHYLTMGPAGGKMGKYGAKNPYSLESIQKRTMAEIEVNQSLLRVVTTTLEGETLSEIMLQK